jgi:hypothetical protein
MRPFVTFAAVTALAALTVPAVADPTPQEAILAQTLFDEARALVANGSYADACPKFAESYRLDPGGGTLLNLGMCHESEGKFASAYAELSEALSQAIRDKRSDREKTARDHLAVVTPKLSRLRVKVAAGEPADLQVKVDGIVLARAAWGVAVPMDPGAHAVVATAEGRLKLEQSVTLEADGSTKELEIGALAADPNAPARSKDAPPPGAAEPSSGMAPLRIVGITTAAVGGVSLVVGGIFGGLAAVAWSNAHAACPNNGCPSITQVDDGKRAGVFADVSTVLLVAGGVLAVGGVVLAIVAPSGKKAYVAPTASGLIVGGSF